LFATFPLFSLLQDIPSRSSKALPFVAFGARETLGAVEGAAHALMRALQHRRKTGAVHQGKKGDDVTTNPKF